MTFDDGWEIYGSQKPNEVWEPHTPHVKQALYIRCLTMPNVNTHLAVGGAGGGKTYAVCMGISDRATSVPGDEIAVVRKFAKDLNDTVIKDLFDNVNPELIADYRRQDKDLYLHTIHPKYKTRICFRGLDDVERWGSKRFTCIFIIEANEVSPTDISYLRTRLRHQLPADVDLSECPYAHQKLNDEGVLVWDVTRFISMDFNPPREPEHWLTPLWKKGTMLGKRVTRSVTHFKTSDNPNLPPGYMDQMKESMPAAEFERMVEGEETTGIQGVPCTPHFSEYKHVFKGPFPSNPVVIYRGFDPGWRHPAYIWVEYNRDDETARIWHENFGTQIDVRDFLRTQVIPSQDKFHPDTIYIDSIDPYHADQHNDKDKYTTRQILKYEFGITSKSYPHHPRDGAQLINKLFRQNRLQVHESCEILIKAFKGGWHKEDDGEEPAKDGYFEHIADAARYVLWRLFGKHAKRGQVKQRTKTISTPDGLYQMTKGGVLTPNRQNRQLVLPSMRR